MLASCSLRSVSHITNATMANATTMITPLFTTPKLKKHITHTMETAS